jgi:SAM-dependent methyltransferase
VEPNKVAEIANAQNAVDSGRLDKTKPFGPTWPPYYWTKWSALSAIVVHHLHIPPGSDVLDVGCGPGWTSAFLAESGYRVLGLDVAPAWVRVGQERARRWDVSAEFQTADMDDFYLGRSFDAALVFDALHHSERPAAVVRNIARHIRPGGWVVFGEPSWLHSISPHAKATSEEQGAIERGIAVSALKRWCAQAGLGHFRRFFEGTEPYERRVIQFGWQLIRLVAANVWVAPQASIWLAAQKQQHPG